MPKMVVYEVNAFVSQQALTCGRDALMRLWSTDRGKRERERLQCFSQPEEEEEEDYKLWPANKSDRSWQSLSNPAKRHSFVSN